MGRHTRRNNQVLHHDFIWAAIWPPRSVKYLRKRLWLIFWLLGILFPMAFLGTIWPAFGYLYNAVFAPGWMHVIMHTFLYAVLGILLSYWFKSLSIRSVVIVIGLAFLVGCFHEGLQILTAGHWPGWFPEIFDLSVDIAGATIGLALVRLGVGRGVKPVSRLPKQF
jgi:hypothetical protein